MCLFVGNTQIQEGSEEGTPPVPTRRQYRQADSGEEYQVIWSGTLQRNGLAPSLSNVEYHHGQSPLAKAASRELAALPKLPSLTSSTPTRAK
jgi:hypothetical protein